MKGGKNKIANTERKSRLVIGLLAIAALAFFLATTFASATAILWIAVIVGILGSIFIYIETGIVSYFKQSKWKSFTFGDIMVFFGVIVATALLIQSLAFIPAINKILPIAISNFTTITARIVAVIAIVMAFVFALTPKFD